MNLKVKIADKLIRSTIIIKCSKGANYKYCLYVHGEYCNYGNREFHFPKWYKQWMYNIEHKIFNLLLNYIIKHKNGGYFIS